MSPSLDIQAVSGPVLDALSGLVSDPIPNIRFNVAKCMEDLVTTHGSTAAGRAMAREKIVSGLQTLVDDSDADVRYYASKALEKTMQTISAGELCVFGTSVPY